MANKEQGGQKNNKKAPKLSLKEKRAAKKEKQSKWGIVLVLFISFIMVSSIIGFIYSDSARA